MFPLVIAVLTRDSQYGVLESQLRTVSISLGDTPKLQCEFVFGVGFQDF